MKSDYTGKTGKEGHEERGLLKTPLKREKLGNTQLIKRLLKWLARGSERSGRSNACRS